MGGGGKEGEGKDERRERGERDKEVIEGKGRKKGQGGRRREKTERKK